MGVPGAILRNYDRVAGHTIRQSPFTTAKTHQIKTEHDQSRQQLPTGRNRLNRSCGIGHTAPSVEDYGHVGPGQSLLCVGVLYLLV